MRKFFFVSGLIIGYVFGTRAGRKRYEQIKSATLAVWGSAPVQHGVDSAKDFASSHVSDLSDTALDALKKLIRIATTGARKAETVSDEAVAEATEVVTTAAKKASK